MKDFFEKHKIKIAVICSVVLFLVVGFLILPNDYKVFAKTKGFELELGSQIDENISTYIWGMEDAVGEAELDISQVDVYTAGHYQIYVNIGKRTISYDVKIIDTVAPTLVIDESVNHIAVNREYDAYKFVAEVTDLSDTAKVYYKVNDVLQDTISFNETGAYEITLVAKDISGNEIEQTTTINVDVPPQFIGLVDVTIPVGASFDYTQGFVIYDETDGFITDTVLINDEGVDLATEGTYEIVYSVINSNGVDNSKMISITTSADASNEYKTANYLTVEELQLLCDKGYFSYQPLEEENYDAVLALIIPTSVNVGTERMCGSGFIYKMTPEYLYIGSVEHVTEDLTSEAHIIFYNDVKISCAVDDVCVGNGNELSLIRIPIADVPQNTLLALKQAYVDVNIYEEDVINDSIVCHSENWGFNHVQMIYTYTILSINADLEGLGFYDSMVEVAGLTRSGMSGSAVYDYRGRLIGATSCTYNHFQDNSRDRTYFMMIDKIETLEQSLNEQEDAKLSE